MSTHLHFFSDVCEIKIASSNRFTINNLTDFIHIEVEKGNDWVRVALDLQKALNTVDHNIL